MKYRIIERNDGQFEYEVCVDWIDYQGNPTVHWNRIPYLIFRTEEAARSHLFEIIQFQGKANIKRVIEEIEV